jgi:hypothetical protein
MRRVPLRQAKPTDRFMIRSRTRVVKRTPPDTGS